MKFILVLSTYPNLSSAKKIAEALIEKNLAACVQIGPAVKSIYRWKGRVCAEKEVQIWVKTRAKVFKKVSQQISALHPYEVPEIISIPIDEGSERYLKWISSEVGNVRIHPRSS